MYAKINEKIKDPIKEFNEETYQFIIHSIKCKLNTSIIEVGPIKKIFDGRDVLAYKILVYSRIKKMIYLFKVEFPYHRRSFIIDCLDYWRC